MIGASAILASSSAVLCDGNDLPAIPCTPLIEWRKARRLSPKMAARYLRLSPDFYTALEAGIGECGPSIAIDLARRTDWEVRPEDLPGAAKLEDSGAERVSPPAPATDGGEAAGVAFPPGTDAGPGGDAWWSTWLERTGSGHVVAICRATISDETTWRVTPEHAAGLGMELIRAALLAARPGSVPV